MHKKGHAEGTCSASDGGWEAGLKYMWQHKTLGKRKNHRVREIHMNDALLVSNSTFLLYVVSLLLSSPTQKACISIHLIEKLKTKTNDVGHISALIWSLLKKNAKAACENN